MAACLHFLAAAISVTVIIISSSMVSFSSAQFIFGAPAVAAVPALSPEMVPLFPSPGGPATSPAASSLPVIPSTRTPNPDTVYFVNPDTALPPSAPLEESSAVSGQKTQVFFICCCLAYWLVMVFRI